MYDLGDVFGFHDNVMQGILEKVKKNVLYESYSKFV